MNIIFHRGIPGARDFSSHRKIAIIIDNTSHEAVYDLLELRKHPARYNLDMSRVDIIVTDDIDEPLITDAIGELAVKLEGDRNTTPFLKQAVFDPRRLLVAQNVAKLYKRILRQKTWVEDGDAVFVTAYSRVETPAVSYVGPRDYISAQLSHNYDEIIVVGENQDANSLSNILKTLDFLGAEMWA